MSELSGLDLEALLNTRIITASRFSEQESDAPGVISVVSRDEMRRFGGTTLRDVLERVPGLTGTTAYFTDRSMVAARGDQTKIDGGHILLLINGRPTREILEGGIISDVLESFPIDALDHIEVIRGPGSVLYGSNAFSAVVNLITKDVQDGGFSVSGAGGAGGAFQTSGTASMTCGDVRMLASAQMHDGGDWPTAFRIPLVARRRSAGAGRSAGAAGHDRGSRHGRVLRRRLQGLQHHDVALGLRDLVIRARLGQRQHAGAASSPTSAMPSTRGRNGTRAST